MSGFSTARQNMVDGQVRPSDVTDIRIIEAMLAVPREAFVPEDQRALAYLDLDLDVSEGRSEAFPDQAGGDREDAAGGRNQATPTRFWSRAARPAISAALPQGLRRR